MPLKLKRVDYADLNARQKENYNYSKLSAVLADYGYTTMRLNDDWEGADFIAQHFSDGEFLRVQLKSRLAFGEKYRGKRLYVAFRDGADWYLFPHDKLLARVLADTGVKKTVSWSERGGYSFPKISKKLKALLEPYRIPASITSQGTGAGQRRRSSAP